MATPSKTITFDNLNTSTVADMDAVLKDAVFNKHMLLRKMNGKKKAYDGGVYLTEPIINAKGKTPISFKGLQIIDLEDKEVVTTAVYNPAFYETHIVMALTDEIMNAGPAKVFDLLEAKYKVARLTMEDKLSTALYAAGTVSASDPAPMTGLASVLSVVSATPSDAYAGITRDSTAATDYWKNQYKDGVTLAAAFGTNLEILQQLWGSCSEDTEHPDIIVTTQAIYDKIWSKADARQRLGNEEAAKLGYQSIDFNGVPLIVDKKCTAGKLIMLNTNYLYFKVSPSYDIAAGPFLQGPGQMGKVKHIVWCGQLVCSNLRYQGIMFNLA